MAALENAVYQQYRLAIQLFMSLRQDVQVIDRVQDVQQTLGLALLV